MRKSFLDAIRDQAGDQTRIMEWKWGDYDIKVRLRPVTTQDFLAHSKYLGLEYASADLQDAQEMRSLQPRMAVDSAGNIPIMDVALCVGLVSFFDFGGGVETEIPITITPGADPKDQDPANGRWNCSQFKRAFPGIASTVSTEILEQFNYLNAVQAAPIVKKSLPTGDGI